MKRLSQRSPRREPKRSKKETRQGSVLIAQIEDSQEIQKRLKIRNHLLLEKCQVRKLILVESHGFHDNDSKRYR